MRAFFRLGGLANASPRLDAAHYLVTKHSRAARQRRLLLLQPEFTHSKCSSTESSVDDLGTCRGVVLSRAATILRSIETQPSTGRFVRFSRTTFFSFSFFLKCGRLSSANEEEEDLPRESWTCVFFSSTTLSRRSGTCETTECRRAGHFCPPFLSHLHVDFRLVEVTTADHLPP